MAAKYRFTFWLAEELTPEQVNEVECALWAQIEDLGCKLCQLVEVSKKEGERDPPDV